MPPIDEWMKLLIGIGIIVILVYITFFLFGGKLPI